MVAVLLSLRRCHPSSRTAPANNGNAVHIDGIREIYLAEGLKKYRKNKNPFF